VTRPKLLLADDSVTIRKVVELTFADEGVDVTSAGDAQTAMERFVEVQPDIVLVDVGLAGTNGYQICEMIKSDEATRHIPVMLLVGSFEPFDGDEAHRVGADAFMTKPFNSIRDLVSRVTTLLSPQEKNGDAAPASEGEPPALRTRETEDIEDLYRSSFAETPAIDTMETVESFDTIDNLLGDAGMDDDMIEASYLTPRDVETIPTDEPVKAFDWSPEAVVESDSEDQQSTVSEKELDPSEWLDEEKDEHTEEKSSSGQFFDFSKEDMPADEPDLAEDGEADLSTYETVDFSNSPAVVSVPLSNAELGDDEEDELLDIFDEHSRSSFEDPAIHDTIPYSDGEQPPGPAGETFHTPISEETIDEIVRRVVHKLSDEVVRDIARVEVPRVAEKLIREALNQEPKK
jgi:CheY-like chemotaxis protein